MKGIRLFCVITALALFVLFGAALAQDKYPTRPIELVVPFAPGGTADVGVRSYSDNLSKLLGVPVNVVNRAGGTGIQGTAYVARGKKDGYTVLATTDTPLLVMPVISSKEVSYDPLKDFVPIGYFGYAPSIFAVRSDSPFKTLADLIDYARKNPGKLKNASTGLGAEARFNLDLLCHKENIKIPSIPFESGGQAVTALLGGHTDMSSNSLASLSPHLKAGKIRGLAISMKTRHPEFPDIPTTGELKYPDVNFVVWLAVFVPTGVPKQVVDTLIPAVEKAFKAPEVIQRGSNAGLIIEYMGPDETRKLMENGLQLVKQVAAEAGLIK
jgi:tripartite-type tricarboxylate transporter receptor subunit TctC